MERKGEWNGLWIEIVEDVTGSCKRNEDFPMQQTFESLAETGLSEDWRVTRVEECQHNSDCKGVAERCCVGWSSGTLWWLISTLGSGTLRYPLWHRFS